MNKFKKTILTGAATAALLTQTVLPAFAATTITISGNGSNTDNTADVEIVRETTVVQNNTSDISNDINVDANTGDNQANDNTGGDVEVKTGDTDVDVKVANSANTNMAELNGCDCDQDAEVNISGNGTNSDNQVDLAVENTTEVFQENDASVDNNVDVDANTGNNDADDNTGGDVSVKTGNSDVQVDLITRANANLATKNGSNGGGSISALVMNNGSNTDNGIDLEFVRSVLLDQVNTADVSNDVDVDSATGDNNAEDNTGGEVGIKTGNSDVEILVDNMSNFNAADLDCGCILDVEAKVAGNGTESDNEIVAAFEDTLENFQENEDDTDNDVDVDSATGENEADDNTQGSEAGDPSIKTGNGDANVQVYNSNNVNQLGDVETDWEDWMEEHDVHLTFDVNAFLMALLGL